MMGKWCIHLSDKPGHPGVSWVEYNGIRLDGITHVEAGQQVEGLPRIYIEAIGSEVTITAETTKEGES